MPGITYNNNIPLATNSPSVDQPNMKINTNAIDTLLQVDHISFNTTNSGKHAQVTLPNPLVADPTLTGTAGEIYTKAISAAAQLFFANKNGPIQLTGLTTVATANGYITLPGGIIIKWGTATGSSAGSANTFPVAFPANCFSIVFTPQGATPRSEGITNVTRTGFTCYLSTSTPSSVYYIAVGN